LYYLPEDAASSIGIGFSDVKVVAGETHIIALTFSSLDKKVTLSVDGASQTRKFTSEPPAEDCTPGDDCVLLLGARSSRKGDLTHEWSMNGTIASAQVFYY